MKHKNHILVIVFVLICSTLFAQQGRQKRADTLFNKFSFVKAAKVYRELIQKNYNRDYATRKLARLLCLFKRS